MKLAVLTNKKSIMCLLIGMYVGVTSAAVELPNAGQVLKQNTVLESDTLIRQEGIDFDSPTLLDETSNGVKIALQRVVFQGNTVYSNDELITILGDVTQKRFDLGGLRGLANKISDYYRSNGYLFARAFLPAQRLSEEVLTIGVVEGAYGKVSVSGFDADGLSPFLNKLESGNLINAQLLEQKILLLQGIPGLQVRPVMSPSQEFGLGDLNVEVQDASFPRVSLSLDNYGSRYVGQYRILANISHNHLWRTGDQLQASFLISDEALKLGTIAYDRLVGFEGVRLGVSLVKTDYAIAELEESLRGINAKGTATVGSITSSYPLARGKNKSIDISANLDFKRFSDRSVGIEVVKRAFVLPLTLSANMQDNYLGGGLTFASIQATHGNISIENAAAKSQDAATAKTRGRFRKVNVSFSRLQNINETINFFTNINGQWARNNLDSSEDMSLGGPQSIRAYPSGEASSDKAVLGQFELRVNLAKMTPFAFYDIGTGWKNADPWDNAENKRTLAGGGIGLRASHNKWTSEATAAWRIGSERSTSDSSDRTPRLWAHIKYQF